MINEKKILIMGGFAGMVLLVSFVFFQDQNDHLESVEKIGPSTNSLPPVQRRLDAGREMLDVTKMQLRREALDSMHDEMQALRVALSQLHSEQEVLRKRLSEPQHGFSDEGERGATKEKSSAEIQQEMDERVLMLEASLYDEPVDQEWADETLASVTEAFAQSELADVAMVDAACGSTLCRLEVQLGAATPKEDNLQKLSMHRTWNGPTFVAVDPTGKTQLYFAREGSDLPS